MLFALRLTFADAFTLGDWTKLDRTLTEYLPSVELAGSASGLSRSSVVLSFRVADLDAAEAHLAPLVEALADRLGVRPVAHLA